MKLDCIVKNDRIIEGKSYKLCIRSALDCISLCTVFQYSMYRFFQSTTFPFIYSDLYKTITILSLICIGVSRFIYISIQKITLMNSSKERARWIILFFASGILAIPFFIAGLKNDYKLLVFMPLSVLCLYDMKPEKIIRKFALFQLILFLAVCICGLAGCIKNIAFDGHGGFVESYGFVNTTDCAAYVLFILLFIWSSAKDATWMSSVLFSVISVGTAYIAFYFTGSRTTMFCCGFLAIICLWEKLESSIIRHKTKYKWIIKCSNLISIIIFPLMALLLFTLTYLYGNGNTIAKSIDVYTAGGISNTWDVYKQFGVSLFGSFFEMHGHGGSLIAEFRKYDFIDNSYAYVLIRYGIAVFIVFTFLWIWMSIDAIRSGRKRIAFAMAIMAIYALSESHLQEINYNILVAMPFCAFTPVSSKQKWKGNLKKVWHSKIPIIVIIGLFLFSFPVMLSWLRTIIYLNNWNSGMQTIWPMIVCVGVLLLLFALIKMIHSFSINKHISGLIAITIVLLTICSCAFYFDRRINAGLTEKKNEITSEKETIELVQSNSEQPIYVSDKSELYRRNYEGFQGFMMSNEDLCRSHKGTLFVDIGREILPVTQAGGIYCQISNTSGIYSFDPAVISALSEKGFDCRPYYYSERSCDLYDVAELNGLRLDKKGRIILDGKGIRENRFMDQVDGHYVVCFSLSLDNTQIEKDPERKICNVIVSGFKQETIIDQRAVLASDFDDQGRYTVVLEYYVFDMPRMEYLIDVEEETTLYVDKITWKRVS